MVLGARHGDVEQAVRFFLFTLLEALGVLEAPSCP
jgi:hypothetical protein